MEQVRFQKSRSGGVMCRIGTTRQQLGIVAFVERGYHGPLPKAGEIWDVEPVSYNDARSVCFVRPIRRVDYQMEKRIREFRAVAINFGLPDLDRESLEEWARRGSYSDPLLRAEYRSWLQSHRGRQ